MNAHQCVNIVYRELEGADVSSKNLRFTDTTCNAVQRPIRDEKMQKTWRRVHHFRDIWVQEGNGSALVSPCGQGWQGVAKTGFCQWL